MKNFYFDGYVNVEIEAKDIDEAKRIFFAILNNGNIINCDYTFIKDEDTNEILVDKEC
jgi:hypothetical protein